MSIAKEIFADHLLAMYLHGSAVKDGLRPQSDVDVLAVIDQPMTEAMRLELVSALMEVSGPHPASPGGPRCIELMVFLKADLSEPAFPARSEVVYGEWLREHFEAGGIPEAHADPENTLILAQARQQAQPLLGPELDAILSEISSDQIRLAMREALPALLENLHGDERNVLLTLARMWRTASTNEFVSKDAAADWAILRLPDHVAETLAQARDAYLGKSRDDWADRPQEAQQAAAYLHREVSAQLHSE
ncbi:aminoglycoside adenylyltransferase domain-containing protein [Rhizobium sp. BR 314]|uniref:aminoglycoside adenylyltransferase domain-containing protein n=1 Tax=Rhizobium sp. BR 314 TaxID=3040013 RepID=UPI0039BF9004